VVSPVSWPSMTIRAPRGSLEIRTFSPLDHQVQAGRHVARQARSGIRELLRMI
jgi:hypothetical protein